MSLQVSSMSCANSSCSVCTLHPDVNLPMHAVDSSYQDLEQTWPTAVEFLEHILVLHDLSSHIGRGPPYTFVCGEDEFTMSYCTTTSSIRSLGR